MESSYYVQNYRTLQAFSWDEWYKPRFRHLDIPFDSTYFQTRAFKYPLKTSNKS